MISHLRGTLLSVSPACVVSVGGVGFELQLPEKDRGLLGSVQSEVSFYTYLHVREDQLTLFGFLDASDRHLFLKLIGVSGIGPRSALGMLSESSSSHIVRAIQNGDNGYLCKLPGLGRKTAERLVMELKDKLQDFALETAPDSAGAAGNLRQEALLALTSLGMNRNAAERALDDVEWGSKQKSDLESIIKEALKHASTV